MRSESHYSQAIVGLLVVVAVLCFTAGCDHTLAGKWEYREIRRVKSPDSRHEAVIAEGSGGATTSTITSVYLVATGSRIDLKERDRSFFDADHMTGFDVKWMSDDLLEIHYSEARIMNFRNFSYGDGRAVIEVQLHPASTNYALPLRDRSRR